jgi:hypothetical protein
MRSCRGKIAGSTIGTGQEENRLGTVWPNVQAALQMRLRLGKVVSFECLPSFLPMIDARELGINYEVTNPAGKEQADHYQPHKKWARLYR